MALHVYDHVTRTKKKFEPVRPGHVGMYVGRGDMIHAPQSGGHVEVISLAGRYGERFIGARRIIRAA